MDSIIYCEYYCKGKQKNQLAHQKKNDEFYQNVIIESVNKFR